MKFVVDKHLPFVERAFGPLGNLHAIDTAELTSAAVRDADVLVVRSPTTIDKTLLDGSRVKFVGTATIGTDHVDLEYLASRGIAFASAPGSNANSVKEYIVSALLTLAEKKAIALKDLTVGVVGVGHVGSIVCRAVEALGMTTLLNDPPLARRTGENRFVPLERLMEADIMTLHVPLTKEGEDRTFHLFDTNRISRMKKGMILLNTSRGSVVETRALRDALQRSQITMCVLDVWENEPAIDVGLLAQVTLGTPHIAGYSMEGKANAVAMIRDAICRHFKLDATWEPGREFAGVPKTEIDVPRNDSTAQSILHRIVSQCYDIQRDDTMLRKMTSIGPPEQGSYFKSLRSNYGVRREFSHYAVRLPQTHSQLSQTLAALGFASAMKSDSHK